MAEIILHSPLTVEEARERLTRCLTYDFFDRLAYFDTPTVAGRVGKRRFTARLFGLRRNSFAPSFYGRLIASSSGTEIRGRFMMTPLVQLVILVAALVPCSVLAIIVGLEVQDVMSGETIALSKESCMAAMMATGIAGVSGILVLVGRSVLGSEDEDHILEYLERVLEVEPLEMKEAA